MEILSTGSSFLLIFVGFCLLILVHELGHYLAAKWAGIRVEGFSVGMGPPVFTWRRGIGWRMGSTEPAVVAKAGVSAIQLSDAELIRHGIGETEWAFRAIPIGGYVRMLGQEDANPSATSDDPRSYGRCGIGKRMVVVSAGVIANLILAVFLFLIAFLVGVRFNAPLVGGSFPNTPAARAIATNAAEARLAPDAPAGLLAGDTILSIDGEETMSFIDVMLAAAMGRPDEPLELEVRRPGVEVPLRFSITPERDAQSGLLSMGVGSATSTAITTAGNERDRSFVATKLASTGLAAAGVRAGMRLTTLAGRPVAILEEVDAIVSDSNGDPIPSVWLGRDGTTVTAPLPVDPDLERLEVPGPTPSASNELEAGLLGLTPLLGVAGVTPGSPNIDALQANDVFLRVGTSDAPSLQQLRRLLKDWKEPTIPVLVARQGSEVQLDLKVDRGTLGFLPRLVLEEPLIGRVVNAVVPSTGEAAVPTPIAPLQLFPRTRIEAVAGQPVSDWRSLRSALVAATAGVAKTGGSVEVPLTYRLPVGGATETKPIAIDEKVARRLAKLGWQTPVEGIFDPQYVTLQASGPLDAVRMGLRETKKMVLQVYLTIDRLVRRTVGIDQLHGPVGIFHVGTKVADQGFMYLVFFLAAISVNLAVMNFLPLPIVDGGLFLFLVYEKLRGRPPSIAFQNASMAVGLALIGSLFLITFYNDIARLLK